MPPLRHLRSVTRLSFDMTLHLEIGTNPFNFSPHTVNRYPVLIEHAVITIVDAWGSAVWHFGLPPFVPGPCTTVHDWFRSDLFTNTEIIAKAAEKTASEQDIFPDRAQLSNFLGPIDE
jgi:hypothetical protein